MRENRRLLLKGLLGFTTLAAAVTAMPRIAMAKWSAKAFDNTTVDGALTELYGTTDATADDEITLKVPEIAENGAVVPVTVSSDLADVTNISIFADKNPQPLAASFTLPEGTAADVSVRIRLGETQTVKAVVQAGGKLYTKEQEVKVTIGGCGG